MEQRRQEWAASTRAALRDQRLRRLIAPDVPPDPPERDRPGRAGDWLEDGDPIVRAVRFAHLHAAYD